MAKGAVPNVLFSLLTSCSKSVSCATHIGAIPVNFRLSRRRCNFLPLLAGHTSSGRLLWLGDFSQ